MFETLKPDESQLVVAACKVILMTGRASVSTLQRRMRISYTAAARAIDILEEALNPSGQSANIEGEGLNNAEKTPMSTVECPHCNARLSIKTLPDVILCPKCGNRFPTTPKGEQLLKFVITTTGTLDGCRIDSYLGIVSAQVVLGINLFRDIMANVKDAFGGRSGTMERALAEARDLVIQDLKEKSFKLGAEAIVGFSMDFESLGQANGMAMLVGTGTAIKYTKL